MRGMGAVCGICLLAMLQPLSLHAAAESSGVPGVAWLEVSPAAAGWSASKLADAKGYSESIDTAAVVVVDAGRIVAQWGEPARKFNVHSIRKSFLSAMYGREVTAGVIPLEATLAELGIDDNEPSLTALEKQARVIDLMKARSGIYHAALYESPDMIARKPQRGSHPPRSFWSYNNWDFNALGTIFEQRTGVAIGRYFEQHFAQPLQMQDFEASDATYAPGAASMHRAYPFRMTARDMARFGLLFLREGRWRDRQLLPKEWIRQSTTAYSIAEGDSEYGYSGYGLMWWVAVNGNHIPHVELPDGSFSARGWGGHFIVVIPTYDIVVVHRVNTDDLTKNVSLEQFGELLSRILAAKPAQPSGATQ